VECAQHHDTSSIQSDMIEGFEIQPPARSSSRVSGVSGFISPFNGAKYFLNLPFVPNWTW